MRCPVISFAFVCLATASLFSQSKNVLQLHPQNPHYFMYQNKPIIIVGSGEHYGAVMNLDFDYRKYLEVLSASGLNNTRLFTGAYVEKSGETQALTDGKTQWVIYLEPMATKVYGLTLNLPKGSYQATWTDAVTGQPLQTVAVNNGYVEVPAGMNDKVAVVSKKQK